MICFVFAVSLHISCILFIWSLFRCSLCGHIVYMVFTSDGLFCSKGNVPGALVLRWSNYNRDVDLQCTSILEQWWDGCASHLNTTYHTTRLLLISLEEVHRRAKCHVTVRQVRMLTCQEKMFYFSAKAKQNLTTVEFLLIILVRVSLLFLHTQSIALTECLMDFFMFSSFSSYFQND